MRERERKRERECLKTLTLTCSPISKWSLFVADRNALVKTVENIHRIEIMVCYRFYSIFISLESKRRKLWLMLPCVTFKHSQSVPEYMIFNDCLYWVRECRRKTPERGNKRLVLAIRTNNKTQILFVFLRCYDITWLILLILRKMAILS